MRDPLAALLLDVGTVWDVEPVAGPAAGGELAGVDPGVDGSVRDAELLGDLGDGELAVARPRGRVGDLVPPADPLHVLGPERAAGAGVQTGGVELLGDLRVGVIWGEAAGQLDRLGRGAYDVLSFLRSLDGVLLAGARAPPDPDRQLPACGLGGDRDVDDDRAQQPFAVAILGAVGGPKLGQVARERLEVFARWLAHGLGLLGELGGCFVELLELVLPPGLEAASDEPVLRLARVERALSPDRLIPGALDPQRHGAGRPGATIGDLVSGSERERDLLRRQRL